jgi:hypothetical protein
VTRSRSHLIEQDHIHLIRLQQRIELFFRRQAFFATRPSNISPERVSPVAFVVGQPCPGENSESSDRPLPERRLLSDDSDPRSSLPYAHISLHTIRTPFANSDLSSPGLLAGAMIPILAPPFRTLTYPHTQFESPSPIRTYPAFASWLEPEPPRMSLDVHRKGLVAVGI